MRVGKMPLSGQEKMVGKELAGLAFFPSIFTNYQNKNPQYAHRMGEVRGDKGRIGKKLTKNTI